MYKLLIVEDEPIERQAIRLMVSHHCPEIDQVEEAQDGYEALNICKTYSPDIIMLDINMPGLNGLETIRELKKRSNLHARFLILSSYDRFEYAREAIQLHVEDFILKPAKISRLQEAICQTISKIENERQYSQENTALMNRVDRIRPIVESDCVYALISGNENVLLDTFFSFLDFKVKSGFCFVIYCEKMPQMLLSQLKTELQNLGLLSIGQRYHNQLVFFVLSGEQQTQSDAENLIKYVDLYLNQHLPYDHIVTLGGIYENTAAFHQSYQDARKEQKKCLSNRNVASAGDGYDIKQLYADFEQILIKKQANEDYLNDFAARVALNHTFQQSKDMLYRFLILAVKYAEDRCIAPQTLQKFSLEEMATINSNRQLTQYFTSNMCEIISFLQGSSGDFHGIVAEALRFIEKNYCRNITLEDVAAHLNLTANYLSRVLKKQTCQNFIDLITEKRIQKAKELLLQNLSIKEITYLVGFNSQNYFTKIFKKIVGVTPSEYKNALT